jgi:acylphosphatase
MTTHRLHAIVKGQVQGVSFRFYTAQTARALGLQGWVRNLAGGDVEVLAEGEEAALTKLLDFLHTGPSLARVNQVIVNWHTATGEFRRFEIVHF